MGVCLNNQCVRQNTMYATDVDAGSILEYAVLDDGGDGVLRSAAFSVDATTGAMRVADASLMDHEKSYDQGGSFGEAATNGVVVVPVQVKDGKGLVATGHVLVYIRDLNEPPRLTNDGGTSAGSATAVSARRVPEGTVNAGDAGAAAGFVIEPPLTVFDPDAGVNGTIEMELTGGSALGVLRVAKSADGLAFNLVVNSSASLDFEKMHGHPLTARITATDGGGLRDTRIYNIYVQDVNERPVVPAIQVREVREGSAANTPFGNVIAVADPDFNQTLSFELLDSADGLFRVGSTTDGVPGQLYVTSSSLDFETAQQYTLRTNVTDQGGYPTALSAQGFTTANVKDVNEQPVLRALAPDLSKSQ